MKAFLGLSLSLVIGSLIALTGAGRLSDISMRKGYTKQLLDNIRPFERRTVNASEYRFYNNATARE